MKRKRHLVSDFRTNVRVTSSGKSAQPTKGDIHNIEDGMMMAASLNVPPGCSQHGSTPRGRDGVIPVGRSGCMMYDVSYHRNIGTRAGVRTIQSRRQGEMPKHDTDTVTTASSVVRTICFASPPSGVRRGRNLACSRKEEAE